MARRANGEGSIYKKADRYMVQVTIGGKRVQRKLPKGAKRADAVKLRDELLSLTTAPAAQTVKTVGDLLDMWLEQMKGAVRPTSHRRYVGVVEKWAKKFIGQMQLRKVEAADVQSAISEIRKSASARTAEYAYIVFNAAFQMAASWGMIAASPVNKKMRPRYTPRKFTSWTADEARRFLAAASETPHGAMFTVALTTGMRAAEVYGLTWRHIHLETGLIEVVQQLLWVSAEEIDDTIDSMGVDPFYETEKQAAFLVPPKTQRGLRRIGVPRITVEALTAHREAQEMAGVPVGGRDLVFTSSAGGPLDHDNIRRAVFKPLMKSAGVTRIRFHDLRHTAASLALEQRVSPEVVSQMLGHSSVAFTLDTYAHVLPHRRWETADALASALRVRSVPEKEKAPTLDGSLSEKRQLKP